jgi:SNF2 family DNA or RNA helicase
VEEILARPETALFLDCGMGKTLIALTAVQALIDDKAIGRCLVIAPKRVAEHVWPDEIGKWGFALSYSLVAGTPAQRAKALAKEADVYIIGRDNVAWLASQGFQADMCVVDELSSFKSWKSNRFKALKAMRKNFRRFVGLTATPVSNGLLDLFPQMWLVDRGKALGSKLTAYQSLYFRPDKTNGHIVYSWALRPGAKEAIEEKIKPSAISLRAEDWLDVPERLDVFRDVTLKPEALAMYQELERESLLELDKGDITAMSAAALVGKLAQLSGGAVYDEKGLAHALFSDKLDALEDEIEALNGQSAIVYYTYRHELERIARLRPCAVDIREAGAIDAWNKGEIELLLAHPKSAGHGLNLQSGGHHMIWFSLPVGDLDLYEQSCKRLHRQGQTEAVIVHHIMALGTSDYWLYQMLMRKDIFQRGFIEAVSLRADQIKKASVCR